jgi:hypothetical protein
MTEAVAQIRRIAARAATGNVLGGNDGRWLAEVGKPKPGTAASRSN